jgi:purine nucleosidase
MARSQSVWLDTDIGDDTDDILALALICASPELALAGVSTVLGDTAARARLAQTLLLLKGGRHARVRVASGCGYPLPGAITPQHWPNGPARRHGMAQRPCAWPAARLPSPSRVHAVDLLARHLRRHPRKTLPIAIGPLTNFATLLLRDPALVRAMPRMVAMAGEFQRPQSEWNVQCDPLAAAAVFSSGIAIDFIPWSIGMNCTVASHQLSALFAGRTPVNRLLSRAVKLWQRAKSRPGAVERPHLFDPMTVGVLLRPEWFEWRRGHVTVSFAPRTFARTIFRPSPRGPHRVAWKVKASLATDRIWSRICSV